MNRSENIGLLATALAAAQKAFAPIPKDREVTVRTKTGSYKFKYATLDAVRSATQPALAEQGLAIVQGVLPREGGGWGVETILMHGSGEWISNFTPMVVELREGERAGNQQFGGAQTYARRYGWTALVCVTADEDDDGNSADGNYVEPAAPRPPPRPAPPQPSGWVADAQRDGIVDTNRTKGNLKPDIADAPTLAKWCGESITVLDTLPTHAEVTRWWKANKDMREAAEEKMPAEYERLIVALDRAFDRVRAKGIS